MAYPWQHQPATSVYNPVDYGLSREMYSEYGTETQAVSQVSELGSRSVAGQIEVSTIPGHQTRLAITHAGTMPMTSPNLDRWLSSTDHMGLGQSLHGAHASGLSHQQAVTAPISPERFYNQIMMKPGGSQSMWSLMYHGQSIPPPPPGPPPTENMPARMHSVIREIAVPPLQHDESNISNVPTLLPLSFRQPARSQAPLPLKDRGMAHAAPKVPSYHLPLRRDVVPHPITALAPPMPRRKKPSAIDIGLADGPKGLQDYRSVLTAPMQDTNLDGSSGIPGARPELTTNHHYPKTAVFPPSKSSGPWGSSPIRGVALSPLNTNNTHDSRSSVIVDFILSPSLVSDVSKHRSPISRSSQSSPSLWSPQTPRAMSFENVVLVQDNTPPLPTLEWLSERPQTIIEEEIQDETPMEADPPRGRIGDHHDAYLAHKQSRARSCSPPPSAYPKESAFNWEEVDVSNRCATDDDLYCLTPVFTRPVVDSVKYKPTNSAFDVRQTILGCYFKC